MRTNMIIFNEPILSIKYYRHYVRLIERAQQRTLTNYSERHHIIPKCLDGSNQCDNLVRLTPEEHYVAHQFLAKMFPTNYKIIYAVNCMGNSRSNNKLYGWIKRKKSVIQSLNTSGSNNPCYGLFGKDHPAYGRNYSMSLDTRMKISITRLNRLKSGSITPPNLGRSLSDEHKQNLSNIRKGKPSHKKGKQMSEVSKTRMKTSHKLTPKLTCPHCGKIGDPANLHRWHFSNCKTLKHQLDVF